jgi:hypothetical protein
VVVQRDAGSDPLFITRRRLANVHTMRGPPHSVPQFANVSENECERASEKMRGQLFINAV